MRKFTTKERVIELLKQGEMITCSQSRHYGKRERLVYAATLYGVTSGRSSTRVHHSTIASMIKDRIINGPNEDKSISYKLINR